MRATFLLAATCATLALPSCFERRNVPCQQDSNCDIGGGGICLAAETGSRWCAYPDAACASGYRYANDDVGDGVAGTCSVNPPTTLSVTLKGNGTGRITSQPSGIDCPGTCSASFAKGTSVTLTEASKTSVFMGWSDPCTSDCTLTLDMDKHVEAQFAIPGSNIWLSQLHSSQGGDIRTAKVLSNNDIIIGGSFFGTMTIGTSAPLSQTNGSNFVARLRGSDGSLIWINQFDGSQTVLVKLVDADSRDDVFIAGQFSGTVPFNGTNATSAGSVDVFIAKLSGSTGRYVWAHTFGDPSLDLATAMAVDHAGDVSLTGYFSGTIAPGPSPLTGTNATYIVKYVGATGAHAWSKSINSTDTQSGDYPNGLAVDASGNVIVLGFFDGSINFGGGSVMASSNGSAFLVKYASENGAYILDREFSNNGTTPTSVASDSNGNIYLLGTFGGTLVLTSPPLPSAGDLDVFVAKYSAAGVAQWSRSFGNSLKDTAVQLAVDPAGELLVSATFQGTVSYGGPSFVAAGASDVVIARLRSQDGSYLGSITLGGTGGEHASVIGAHGGNVVISGGFGGTAGFGGQTLTAPSSSGDGFALLVVPLNP